jgi:hypothetical protein
MMGHHGFFSIATIDVKASLEAVLDENQSMVAAELGKGRRMRRYCYHAV